MIPKLTISANIEELLSKASEAVESFHPGHWDLMSELEKRAQAVLEKRDIEEAISFFVDIAFLKQPYRIDRRHLLAILSEERDDIFDCLEALANIEKLDYSVMDTVAELPYFGRHGGRSFNSAVVRLVSPSRFAIIDWRNLAVMANAPGFEGLVVPPITFGGLSAEQILELKGRISYSQELYIQYNDTMRGMAAKHEIEPAELDLVLWTFSIQKQPFKSYQSYNSLFDSIFTSIPQERLRRELKGKNRTEFVDLKIEDYLAALKDLGYLSNTRVRTELCSIFSLIKRECVGFGQKRPPIRQRIARIVNALNSAIEVAGHERLLSKWKRWEDMVNPASPYWIGIELPGSMLLEGYMIFEDLIPIRKYFEESYIDGSFEPHECEDHSI